MIGITGHCKLAEHAGDLVYRALRESLRRWEGPQLRGITCLAQGADQLFARAILDAGGSFEVILPAADYRDAQVQPDNRAEFDELLSRAAGVTTMPFGTSGTAAYAAANEEMLRRSERVLAVWDGASGGPGSTADAVEAALRAGLQVEVVWPEGAQRA